MLLGYVVMAASAVGVKALLSTSLLRGSWRQSWALPGSCSVSAVPTHSFLPPLAEGAQPASCCSDDTDGAM